MNYKLITALTDMKFFIEDWQAGALRHLSEEERSAELGRLANNIIVNL